MTIITKRILATALAIAYLVGIIKAFNSGVFIGLVSIFIPPIAIFMLFS